MFRAGVTIDTKTMFGFTPLLHAALTNNTYIVLFFIQIGANIEVKDVYEGYTALIIACKFGFYEVASILLENGAMVNAANKFGETSLFLAVDGGFLDVVELLVSNNADLEKGGWEHNTPPLVNAAGKGYVNIVQHLISHGANVNAVTERSATALHYAANRGHLNIARYIQ